MARSTHVEKNAVDAARAIAAESERKGRRVFVAGSIGSIGDSHSYNPTTALSHYALLQQQKRHAGHLARLGVETHFCETIPTLDEAAAVSQAASETGLPFVVSFTLNERELFSTAHHLRMLSRQLIIRAVLP